MPVKQKLTKAIVLFFRYFGMLCFVFFLLGFTSLPYWAYHGLGTAGDKRNGNPTTIVVLGGAGMPSPDGLIRCYYAAEAAEQFKSTKIIIALPYNEGAKDSLRQLNMMAHELVIRGIDSTRISYEPLGFNTRSQAVNISKMIETGSSNVIIVSSPEHIYRAVKTFKKVGFNHVSSLAAFEKPVDEEKIKDKEHTKDTRVKNLTARYNLWSYLGYELLVTKESIAISYYWLKGWI